MKKEKAIVKSNNGLYLTPLTEDIFEMIRKARKEILDIEINAKGVLSDANVIDKISNIKYQLGHLLTKEL